ncbi:uncharacterized protein LOC131688460 isoform X2 [Topomyia yanbarensis]|nr:uncharacterized protein LOC131688460 isoform X2 [Topomyia yanbarensis]
MSHIRQIRQACESLQPQHAGCPMSESRDQYTIKFPLRQDSAKLIHSAPRINYLTTSQAALRNDLLKTCKSNPKPHDSLICHMPADAYKFGQNCNKPVERPTGVIYTNETGFAKHLDPYLSITERDFPPHIQPQNDCITFWNWNSNGRDQTVETVARKPTTVQRHQIPVPKRPLRKAFTSECSSQYRAPTSCVGPKADTVSAKLAVLEPTDPVQRSTEYCTYGSGVNCARILKQRRV